MWSLTHSDSQSVILTVSKSIILHYFKYQKQHTLYSLHREEWVTESMNNNILVPTLSQTAQSTLYRPNIIMCSWVWSHLCLLHSFSKLVYMCMPRSRFRAMSACSSVLMLPKQSILYWWLTFYRLKSNSLVLPILASFTRYEPFKINVLFPIPVPLFKIYFLFPTPVSSLVQDYLQNEGHAKRPDFPVLGLSSCLCHKTSVIQVLYSFLA